VNQGGLTFLKSELLSNLGFYTLGGYIFGGGSVNPYFIYSY